MREFLVTGLNQNTGREKLCILINERVREEVIKTDDDEETEGEE